MKLNHWQWSHIKIEGSHFFNNCLWPDGFSSQSSNVSSSCIVYVNCHREKGNLVIDICHLVYNKIYKLFMTFCVNVKFSFWTPYKMEKRGGRESDKWGYVEPIKFSFCYLILIIYKYNLTIRSIKSYSIVSSY